MTTRHLTRVEQPATEFFIADALTTRMSAAHGGCHYDIEGALEAGQYGAAFIATRLALHNALFMYLARERRVSWLPPDLREVGSAVFELLESRSADDFVTAAAWRLECLNPETPEEVTSFAQEYLRLFSEVLELDRLRVSDAMRSDSVYGEYLDCADELSAVFAHLGVHGINLPNARARIDRRTAVNRHLFGGDVPANAPADPAAPVASGPASGGVSPDGSAALTADDVAFLQMLLRDRIAQTEQRIATTDGRDERRELITVQQRCEWLLGRLRS